MLSIRRSVAILSTLALLLIALPASAKPVSTYSVDVASFDASFRVVVSSDGSMTAAGYLGTCQFAGPAEGTATFGKRLTEATVSVTVSPHPGSPNCPDLILTATATDRISREKLPNGRRLSVPASIDVEGVPFILTGSLVQEITRP